MTFHPGQKVECIADDWSGDEPLPPVFPRKGRIYTVHSVKPVCDCCGFQFLGLAGISNHWTAAYFRPVVEKKTDISILTALLTPSSTRDLEHI